jgi:hypothetical protein
MPAISSTAGLASSVAILPTVAFTAAIVASSGPASRLMAGLASFAVRSPSPLVSAA